MHLNLLFYCISSYKLHIEANEQTDSQIAFLKMENATCFVLM